MKVLFMHGLEGSPEGTKVRALREQGFDVRAADMHMSLWALDKENSAARNLLRLREVRVAVGAGLLGGAFGWLAGWRAGALVPPAIAAGWLFARRHALMGEALGASLERCAAIQADAIAEVDPDVVVASSWGGAVAAKLIAEERWSGPTVLLAPAIARVRIRARRAERHEPALRALAERAPVLVFHDPSDEVVPHADSLRLVAGSRIELRSVEAKGHRLLGLLESGALADALRSPAMRPRTL